MKLGDKERGIDGWIQVVEGAESETFYFVSIQEHVKGIPLFRVQHCHGGRWEQLDERAPYVRACRAVQDHYDNSYALINAAQGEPV